MKQQILYSYLKQNVGWLCPDLHGFQKKCIIGCWLHHFFFELEFVVEKNSFLSCLERDATVNWIIWKYKQKHDDFYSFFNEELI